MQLIKGFFFFNSSGQQWSLMAQRNNLPHALAKQARLFEGLVYCWHVLFFGFGGFFIDQSKDCSNYPEPVECRIKFVLGQNSTTKKSDSLSRLDA